MLRRENDEEEKRVMERSGDRGFESPMELDSSPLLWFNSAVPPTREEVSPDRIIAMSATPKMSFDATPRFTPHNSSPLVSNENSARSSPYRQVAGPKRKFGGFGGWFAPSSPSRLRPSPLSRRGRPYEEIIKETPPSEVFQKKKKKDRTTAESSSTSLSNNLRPSANTVNSQLFYLPVVIMGYIQVAFNVILISGVLYFLLQFFLTIRRDVQIKVNEQLAGIMGEISLCSRQYIENRCSPDLRVPAMEKACLAWEQCMRRDPSVIGRAKLSAETFAEIINGLIEPISYKTMVFILTALFGTIFLSNYAFSMARSRVAAGGNGAGYNGPTFPNVNMTPSMHHPQLTPGSGGNAIMVY